MRNWKYLVTGLSCAALMAVTPMAQMNVPGMSVVVQAATDDEEAGDVAVRVTNGTYNEKEEKTTSIKLGLNQPLVADEEDISEDDVQTVLNKENWTVDGKTIESVALSEDNKEITVVVSGEMEDGDSLNATASLKGKIKKPSGAITSDSKELAISGLNNTGVVEINNASSSWSVNTETTSTLALTLSATPEGGLATALGDVANYTIKGATVTEAELSGTTLTLSFNGGLADGNILTLGTALADLDISGATISGKDITISKAQGGSTETSNTPVTINSIDFVHQSMYIEGGENTKIYVSFPKVNKSGEYKETKAISYDVGEDGVIVDLSSQKVDKDFYVEVSGNYDTKPVVYKFEANTKIKADKWNGATGTVDVLDSKTKKPVENCMVEYCTQNGDWQTLAHYDSTGAQTLREDLSMYQENGATLRMRVSASMHKGNYTPVTALKKKVGKDSTDVETRQVVGSFASNEVKVKVGKRPNGPKVTVDYKNRSFKLASTGKYRIYQGTQVVAATKDGLAGADKVDLTNYIENAGSIDAWLEPDTAKKKAKSAYTAVQFNAIKVLKVEPVDTQKAIEDVKNAKVVVEGETGATITATVEEVKDKSGKVTSYNVKISNKTGYACEVVIGGSADGNTKGKSVKDDKDITLKKVNATDKVYVRIAGDAKAKVWATDYKEMGIVCKEAPAATATPTPTQPTTGEVTE